MMRCQLTESNNTSIVDLGLQRGASGFVEDAEREFRLSSHVL